MALPVLLSKRAVLNLIADPDDLDQLAPPEVYICSSDVLALTRALSTEWRKGNTGNTGAPSVSSNEVHGIVGILSVDGLDTSVDPNRRSHVLHDYSWLMLATVFDGFMIAVEDIKDVDLTRSPAAPMLFRLLRAIVPIDSQANDEPITLIVVEHIGGGTMHVVVVPARRLVYRKAA
jgi:hypothetical protein